jgi:hypothetical protein
MATSDAAQPQSSRSSGQPTMGTAPSESRPAGPGPGLVLRTSFFVLDWTLNFTRPTATLDGQPYRLPWGEHFIPLEPGQHQLQMSYPWLRRFQAGKAAARFNIAPDQVVRASYRAPNSVLVAFRPGTLRLGSSAR